MTKKDDGRETLSTRIPKAWHDDIDAIAVALTNDRQKSVTKSEAARAVIEAGILAVARQHGVSVKTRPPAPRVRTARRPKKEGAAS